MNVRLPHLRAIAQGLLALVAMSAVAVALYAGLYILDFRTVPGAPGPLALLRDPDTAQTVAGLGEVTVAVLGIAITVVAIIVELAANRYTPRISELFLRDPINAGVLSFFSVTAVMVLWVEMSLYGPTYPVWMVTAIIVMMSTSILAMLPYFLYVFDFLSPTSVITRIQHKTMRAFARVGPSAAPRRVHQHRTEAITGIEQLGDIAMNSIDKKDKAIAIAAVHGLAEIARSSLENRATLPPGWFDVESLAARDQDLVALHPSMVHTFTERQTWAEMKVYRQYQAIYAASLLNMRDLGHLVAIHTRRLAISAVEANHADAVDLSVRFMNTFLRAAINARDVRSAYNLYNEYRALGESLLDLDQTELVVELATRFKYYGQISFAVNLPFILETAAYDLCTLLEKAHEAGSAAHDDVLGVFLDVDREPDDSKAQEASLRGVRKAQIKLATYYLIADDMQNARRIFDDMRHEQTPRLISIRDEMLRIDDAEFWEVSDRGINFDYLPPERREKLREFFGWFDHL